MSTLADLFVRIFGDDTQAQRVMRRVRTDLGRLDRTRVNPRVRLDSGRTAEQVTALRANLYDLRRKEVMIPIRLSRIDGEIAIVKRQIQDLENQKATAEVGVDTRGMDVEIEKAKRRLATLERRRIRIPVELERVAGEIASIEAQLAALEHKRIRIPIDIDTKNLRGQQVRISKMFSWPLLIGGASVAAGSLAAVTAGLFSMGAAATPAFAAITAGGNSLLALGQGAAVAVGAFNGVGTALKAMTAVDDAAANNAVNNAKQREAAAESIRAANVSLANAIRNQREQEIDGQRSIREAIRRVSDARASGNDRILSAERTLRNAQEDSRQAQKDLTRARKDAVTQLNDLRASLSDIALDEEDATLGLIRAQERLQEAQRASSGASVLDMREANLAVRQAQARLADVKKQHQEVVEQVADGERKGVAGAANVIAARDKLAEAQEREADAAREARDAQVSAARDVADAQEGVARAQEAAARTAGDAARSVAEAQHQVKVANDAAALSSEKTASQVNTLAAAMSKLSPAAQQFVRFLHDELLPDLKQLKTAASENLFPQLTQALRTLSAGLLPTFVKGTKETADALGDLAVEAAGVLTSGPFRRDFAALLSANAGLIRTYGSAGLSLASVFKDIAVASIPVTQRFADFVKSTSESAAAMTEAGRESGKLEGFFNRAGDVAAQLGRILGNIGLGIFHVGQAGQESGQKLLDSFEQATAKFKEMTGLADTQNKLKEYFEVTAESTKAFGRLLNTTFLELMKLGGDDHLPALIESVRTDLVPALGDALSAASRAFGPKIVSFLTTLAGTFERLTGDGGALTAFVETLNSIFTGLNKILDSPFGGFVNELLKIAGVAAALGLVASALSGIGGVVSIVIGVLATLSATTLAVVAGIAAVAAIFVVAYKKNDEFRARVDQLADALGAKLGPVLSAIGDFITQKVWPALKQFGGYLINTVVPAVLDFATGLGEDLYPIVEAVEKFFKERIVPAIGKLTQAFKDAWPGISNLIKVIGGLILVAVKLVAKIIGFVIPWILKLAGPIFGAVISVIGLVIKIFGKLSGVVASVVRFVINTFLTMVGAIVRGAADAFGWVPGLGGKLKGAADAFDRFKNDVNSKLKAIDDKDVKVGVQLSDDAKKTIKSFGKRNVVLDSRGEVKYVRLPNGGKFYAYAAGGRVKGPGGPTDDAIDAKLSNDEHVVTAKEVTGAGGHAAVEATRAMWRAAGGAGPKFRVSTDFPGGVAVSRMANKIRGVRDVTASGVQDTFGTYLAMQQQVANYGPGGKFAFPLPKGKYRVGVGWKGYKNHNGQDFPVPLGTPTYAPFGGQMKVTDLGNRSYGRYVAIQAGGMKYIGAHLSRFARGSGPVAKGELVGFTGSTGNSTGPHLHTGFFRNGRVVNPRSVLSFDRGGLLYPGQMGMNFGRKPERVSNPEETQILRDLLDSIKRNGRGGPTVIQQVTVEKRRTAFEMAEAASRAFDNGWTGI